MVLALQISLEQQQVPEEHSQLIATQICDSLALWAAVLYSSTRHSNVLVLPLQKQNKQHL